METKNLVTNAVTFNSNLNTNPRFKAYPSLKEAEQFEKKIDSCIPENARRKLMLIYPHVESRRLELASEYRFSFDFLIGQMLELLELFQYSNVHLGMVAISRYKSDIKKWQMMFSLDYKNSTEYQLTIGKHTVKPNKRIS